MKRALLLTLTACLALPLSAQDRPPAGVTEQYSYAMGVRLGQLLKGQGVTQLDSKAFAAAIDDVLQGRTLRLDQNEMQAAIRAQQRQLADQRAQRARDNLERGQRFLAENAGKSDVAVLPSGVQYRVLQQGAGEQSRADDTVRVHYQGSLLNGEVFDSSLTRGQPAEFPLNAVIPGFREALSRMRVGDRWQVFIPSAMAYGEKGAGADIGPNETLIFDIELLDLVR